MRSSVYMSASITELPEYWDDLGDYGMFGECCVLLEELRANERFMVDNADFVSE